MNEGAILITRAESLPFLMALHRWGIGIIEAIQSVASPELTVLVKIITALGTEIFFLPAILLVFWCFDEKKGFRLGLLVIISAWINITLKDLFNQPRPYELEPSLGLVFEPSRAFPSGHAQASLTFWPALAFCFIRGKKLRPLVWMVPVFMILLIGFTRLYLGAHFPTDILGGWIAGGLVLGLFWFLEKRAVPVLVEAGKRPGLIAAAGGALIMNALHPADKTLAALLLGFCVGYSLMIWDFPFFAPGEIAGQKPGPGVLLSRIALGIIGTAALYPGLKLILPGEGSLTGVPGLEGFYELGHFICYGVLGFWFSAGAPWVFRRLGLAAPGNVTSREEP